MHIYHENFLKIPQTDDATGEATTFYKSTCHIDSSFDAYEKKV